MMDKKWKRILMGLSMVWSVWVFGTGSAQGQFTQNRDKIHVDPSGYPPEVRKAYGVFAVRCGKCHGLDETLKPSMPSAQWVAVVKQMQAMASSNISDKQVQPILDFINYDELHRKALTKSAVSPSGSDSIVRGRQFYFAQSCDACHSIAGKGGSAGPPLTDIGVKRSQDQLMQVIQRMKTGNPESKMPPLPPDTMDQQITDLVNFLATLGR